MKIRFTTSVAGERFSYEFDEVADLRVDIARGFLKAGQAVPVDDDAIETATVAAPETAARRPKVRRGLGKLFQ